MKTKPRPIIVAIRLFWVSLALAPIKLLIDWSYLSSLGSVAFLVYVLVFTLAFTIFFFWKIGQGKNWARITFLVFFLLGLPFFFSIVLREFVRSFILGTLSVLQTMLQVGAFVLIFTKPGKQWFQSLPEPPATGPAGSPSM